MTSKKKLLFVSNSSSDRISHILDAFKNRNDLDVEVEHLWMKKRQDSFFAKVFDKFKIPLDFDGLNKRILNKINTFKPNIVFIVKGNNIYPSTLKKIKKVKGIKLVSWSQDDMYARHNRSYFYTKGIKYYDIVVTQKSYNVSELKSIGAKKVVFQNKAYSKIWHKPCVNVEFKSDVLFIGFAEKERFNDLNYLAKNGVKIDVFGSGWDKKEFMNIHPNLNVTSKDLLGENYANAIACSKISLCFLRKANRDLQTSRSVEIPACGGTMIAERTDEHKALFEEDKEAIYFDSKEELLYKVRYYLEHEEERIALSKRGFNRVVTDDYSYDHRVNNILEILYEN